LSCTVQRHVQLEADGRAVHGGRREPLWPGFHAAGKESETQRAVLRAMITRRQPRREASAPATGTAGEDQLRPGAGAGPVRLIESATLTGNGGDKNAFASQQSQEAPDAKDPDW
jgi:hypothetical protein